METAERAEILFNELDNDAGGEITEDEFIRWANKQTKNKQEKQMQQANDDVSGEIIEDEFIR